MIYHNSKTRKSKLKILIILILILISLFLFAAIGNIEAGGGDVVPIMEEFVVINAPMMVSATGAVMELLFPRNVLLITRNAAIT